MKIDRQKLKIQSAGIGVLCGVMAVVTGCSTGVKETNAVKSELVTPAPDAGFIDNPERQTRRADLPFQKVWIKPDFDVSAYQELVVAPVNTQYVMEMDWLHKAGSASWLSDVKKDITELAQYFHAQVVKEFKEDPNQRFRVIEFAGQHKEPALRLELALIQIDPSQPVLHALGWLQVGGGTAAGAINQRRAAFEGRLRDMQTGEVVATFADRDMQDAGPLDLTRLTWYGPAKGIMDRWAEQFVKIANRKPGEMVTDPVPYTLKPF
ncbi:MAG: DUF3313 family protein [Methylomicrobium sp.]|nr:DUF3313 family protein [Methylomicrobium sp.]